MRRDFPPSTIINMHDGFRNPAQASWYSWFPRAFLEGRREGYLGEIGNVGEAQLGRFNELDPSQFQVTAIRSDPQALCPKFDPSHHSDKKDPSCLPIFILFTSLPILVIRSFVLISKFAHLGKRKLLVSVSFWFLAPSSHHIGCLHMASCLLPQIAVIMLQRLVRSLPSPRVPSSEHQEAAAQP